MTPLLNVSSPIYHNILKKAKIAIEEKRNSSVKSSFFITNYYEIPVVHTLVIG